MRKTVFSFVLLCATLGIHAQTGAAAQRVAQIRTRYAQAKQMAAEQGTLTETQNQLTITGSFMCPGTGHRDEVINYYFLTDFDEESNNYYSQPYIIIRSYNIAARKFYEELLYDEQGNLIFAFLSNDSDASDTEKDEVRLYFGEGGVVHRQVKGEPSMTDEVLVLRLANDLEEAFHRIMNREF